MPDFRLNIEIKDVALGDVRDLAEQIMDDNGDGFDAARGDFVITALEKAGENVWVPVELEEEE